MACFLEPASAQAVEQIAGRGSPSMVPVLAATLNKKDEGYRGIWYKTGKADANGKFKYSGGLATYSAKHQPFAIYCKAVNKTFFCYGGAAVDDSRHLLSMVSYYDHATNTVPRPTIVFDKQAYDANDNPVISIDQEGYIWLMSSSHGIVRPSFIHRSKRPYQIDEFEMLSPKRQKAGRDSLIDNFSFMQAFHTPEHGFLCLFTSYIDPVDRTSFFMSSKNGRQWSNWKRLGAIGRGHFQVGAYRRGKIAAMMNYHPAELGLDSRTNLYYLESEDGGKNWQSVDKKPLKLPLTEVKNPALVHDYESKKLIVYLKDLRIDSHGNPVMLYLTSRDAQTGPAGDPRTWRVAHWTEKRWRISDVTTSDHNYDMGSLYLESDGTWRIIAPTAPGPQRGCNGGDMIMWISKDKGNSWRQTKQLTHGSRFNHAHARRPVNAHPDFYAFWADGSTTVPSDSALYFCNREGEVYRLPRKMKRSTEKPELLRSLVTSGP